MRKVIFVLLDGLGDLPIPPGKKTFLETTEKPNLDRLAREGVCGLLYSIDIGVIPGSDTSQLNLLGYNPQRYYPGRGPLEALGAGLDLKEGEVAFRANYATVDDDFIVRDRRAGRIPTEEGDELEGAIEEMEIDGLTFRFKHTVEHRGVVIVSGEGVKVVGDTDPHEVGKAVVQPPISRDNARMVRAINKYIAEVHRRLKEHPLNQKRIKEGKPPANILLLRGGGVIHEYPEPFSKKYGMRACCIAGAVLYKGITRYLGMDVLEVEGATGDYNTDLEAKAKAAVKALKDYDFVYLHVKATDNAGHDGDVKRKADMVRKFDKVLPLLEKSGAVLVITSDHSTPVVKKEHSHEPVPFLIANVIARRYGVKAFSEVECAKGELGRIKGKDVMPLVMAYAERAEKYGS